MEDWYTKYKQAAETPWALTQLPAAEEKKFQDWLLNTPWYKQLANTVPAEQLKRGVLGPTTDYDYRGAYKAGVVPEEYAFDEGRYHWPSQDASGRMLKSPTHPTAWMEYFMQGTGGIDPNEFGLRTPEAGRTFANQLRSVINANSNLGYGISPLLFK